jgi:hypothetical protein
MFVLYNQHSPFQKTEMQLKTILTFRHPNKSKHRKSFVFGKIYSATTEDTDQAVVVEIKPRKNSKPICSECNKPCPQYDTMPTDRYFEFVPFWNIAVYFVYRMRRVTCPEHGVIVEGVPWGDGK